MTWTGSRVSQDRKSIWSDKNDEKDEISEISAVTHNTWNESESDMIIILFIEEIKGRGLILFISDI